MSWIELPVDVECPNCGEESIQYSEFNTLNGDNGGIHGSEYEVECWTCDKTFYFKAYLSFDVEADSYKKKAKVKK